MQLERFREAKADEIRQLQKAWKAGLLAERGEIVRPDFFGALAWQQGLPAVIAEYKRASPSRGRICDSLSVEDVALAYARSGASALSILTEERYFDGQIGYLDRAARVLSERPLPILRKDFLFDPLQVYATAQTQASAILLIVRLTPDVRTLRTLRELAERLGLCAVVEVFDRQELALARESGARIIQVNARDLERRLPLPVCVRHWPRSAGSVPVALRPVRNLRNAPRWVFPPVWLGRHSWPAAIPVRR